MKKATIPLALLVAITAVGGGSQPDPLPVVSYAELCGMVRDLRGKVVIVYFYADYCTPCKAKGLPTLVELHEKYGKDGLEVIAANIDKPSETKARAQLVAWLAKIKARYKAVNVDPATFDYHARISTEGVPAVFIFNRENQWVKKLPLLNAAKDKVIEDVDYPAIKAIVASLLKS
jgi:thiol-disulfide isomerase/thioredoxin